VHVEVERLCVSRQALAAYMAMLPLVHMYTMGWAVSMEVGAMERESERQSLLLATRHWTRGGKSSSEGLRTVVDGEGEVGCGR